MEFRAERNDKGWAATSVRLYDIEDKDLLLKQRVGTVKALPGSFGFVVDRDSGVDVYFNRDSLIPGLAWGALRVGEHVEFDAYIGDQGPAVEASTMRIANAPE